MKKNISMNKYGLLKLMTIFVFTILVVQEVPAQLDKLKKAIKKVESEINKESAKPEPSEAKAK